jgi:hypothetical protein
MREADWGLPEQSFFDAISIIFAEREIMCKAPGIFLGSLAVSFKLSEARPIGDRVPSGNATQAMQRSWYKTVLVSTHQPQCSSEMNRPSSKGVRFPLSRFQHCSQNPGSSTALRS